MGKLALVGAAVLVLAVGFVLATAGDDDPSGPATTPAAAAPAGSTPAATPAAPATPAVPTLTFADGKPQGGVRELSYDKGDVVAFRVRSDVDEEVHVHGFDVKRDVTAGGSTAFRFTARFDGAYEVEMEGSGTKIASLEIQP